MNILQESFLLTWSNYACWLTLPIDVRVNTDDKVYYALLDLQDLAAVDITNSAKG